MDSSRPVSPQQQKTASCRSMKFSRFGISNTFLKLCALSVYVSGQQENNISQIFLVFLNQLHLKWNFFSKLELMSVGKSLKKALKNRSRCADASVG